MDTKTATRQFRLNHWAESIRDRLASGLSIQQYCSEHNISRNDFFYWLKKLREEEVLTSGTQFAKLPVPVQPTSSAKAEKLHPVEIDFKGARIHVGCTGVIKYLPWYSGC